MVSVVVSVDCSLFEYFVNCLITAVVVVISSSLLGQCIQYIYSNTAGGGCIVCEAALIITLYCSQGAGLGVSVGAEVLTRAPLVEGMPGGTPELD